MKIEKRVAVLLFLAILALFVSVMQVTGASSDNKNGIINLKANDIASSGFDSTDLLISPTETLGRPYYNDPTANFYGTPAEKDAITNNNWCERIDDSATTWTDTITDTELRAMWVTWDTNYLYVAIQGQAKGTGNNIICFLDTNADKGLVDFDILTHPAAWQRNFLLQEGIKPNIYVGMWCKDNSADFDGAGSGNAQLHTFNGTAGTWTMSLNGANTNIFHAWYNGSTQSDRTARLFMFKLHWSVLTAPDTVPTVTSLTLRITAASTGGWNGGALYDLIPDGQFSLGNAGRAFQNNYFKIPVFNASGAIRTAVNPRDISGINFFPGSRWDVANPSIPFKVLDQAGQRVKAFSPNGDGINDTIYFSFYIPNRQLADCTFDIYDLRGRHVRTLFTITQAFPLNGGVDPVTWSGYPSSLPGDIGYQSNPLLRWDGRDNDGNTVPMGVYVATFRGQDGNIRVYERFSIAVIR